MGSRNLINHITLNTTHYKVLRNKLQPLALAFARPLNLK